MSLRDDTPDSPPLNEKADLGVEETLTRQEEDEYPGGFKLALLTVALCLSVFILSLDNTIITTAIPKITDHFHSLEDVGWYGSACTTAATQLLFGKFYTFLPVKWTFVAAITLFEAGSLLCGAAPTSTALIIGRALAGLGSAGIYSGSMVIVANSVPLERRPMYNGLIGSMYGIASVAGPLLGGVFTDKLTWRWCFYINLPVGAVTLAVIIFLFKMPRRSTDKKSTAKTFGERFQLFDPWGTLVFIPAIVCLLLALQWGGSKYAWDSWRIILLFVFFGLLIIAFVGIQVWKGEGATIPPRILGTRSVWSGAFFAFSLGSAFMILSFYLPIWFQAIRGVSAVHSGIDNLPIILSLVVASLIAGAGVTAIGYYAPYMIVSSIMAAIGAGLLTTLKVNSGHTKWIPYEIIMGLGLGLGIQQPFIATQVVLEAEDIPIGTSIILFAQTLGGALFVSIGQNVFTNRLVRELVKNVPGVDPQVVLDVGATDLKNAIDPQFIGAVLESYNNAVVSTFYVSVAMACISLIGSLAIEWKSVKGKKIEMGAGGA
ncbi:major facilitator superfamily domain-containing protein [Roridomyces roridus]|uniref:Major facilitator superfamily domain-containing protein n=1 Tax=Roridomyces roridus TaxID=1738132 RepID=A0AAD7BH01_9AGAR|nr:major facilitator superfamily domain-containing protein [Roridomyces roridus]